VKLKVVCLNLWHGGRLFDELVAFLKRESPDVVMMQEVYGGTDPKLERRFRSVPALQEALDYPYAHFAPAFMQIMDEGNQEAGNGVLSRLPFLKTAVIPYGYPYRALRDVPEEWGTEPHVIQHVVVGVGGKETHVMNFHGPRDLDGDNFSDARREMGEAMIRAAEGRQNVIIGGDSNARPTNQALREVAKVLKPVWEVGELKTTFNLKHKYKVDPGYAESVVDVMYVSENIEVLAKDCPDVDVSDHRPLVVELVIT